MEDKEYIRELELREKEAEERRERIEEEVETRGASQYN